MSFPAEEARWHRSEQTLSSHQTQANIEDDQTTTSLAARSCDSIDAWKQ